jgi:uncharacterized protein YjbJ (UPF0337 family)
MVDFVRQGAQGISPASIFSLLTRRFSMKKIMLSVIAVMCLVGFSSLSFAADMGEMKDKMKGEMKEKMGEMKGDKAGEMKGDMKGEMKGDMKGDMKGEMKQKMGEMKEKMGEMKDKMGK